ncbi:galactokinase [soil metagenome]
MAFNSEKILREFSKRFGSVPIVVDSPARVNLIGEHTDYNDGFVLPAAIDKKIVLAMAPNRLNKIRLYASDMNKGEYQTEISNIYKKSELHWPDYILGVIDQLQKRGIIVEGFDCLLGGNIPIGAGLSSSAALEGGVLKGLKHLFDYNLTRLEMAKIGQQAENQFVGVQCGIMDQFANLHGKEGSVIKLDCRNLEFSYHPFDQRNVEILLFDTNVRRELASSEYNVRRKQCEEGVRILKKHDSSIKNLRDVSDNLLERYKNDLTDIVYNRCRYVLDENQRVLDAASDLSAGDIDAFGQRMYRSHYGLRDQYEVSCRELDLLIEATENLEAVLGARMMGGGFGGCTINLVKTSESDDVIDAVQDLYTADIGQKLKYYRATISDGVRVLEEKVSY